MGTGRKSTSSELIRRDWDANRSNPKGQLLLLAFRLTHPLAVSKDTKRWMWICGLPIMITYRVIFEWLLGMELPAKTQVGPGLRVFHGHALVINDHSHIGADCTLRHATTIGCKVLPSGEQGPAPVLGDRVDVGSNVVILGAIVLGDDVTVGAGSVVIRDVPSGATVVGNPASVLSAW